LPNSVLCV
jgi:chemosensory pili system protein ChpA (sensor histidine kinase/response regulator)